MSLRVIACIQLIKAYYLEVWCGLMWYVKERKRREDEMRERGRRNRAWKEHLSMFLVFGLTSRVVI